MKPDWKDAPDWANWLAMDRNGDWFWYADEPNAFKFGWCGGRLAQRAESGVEWESTLEARQ